MIGENKLTVEQLTERVEIELLDQVMQLREGSGKVILKERTDF